LHTQRHLYRGVNNPTATAAATDTTGTTGTATD